MYKEVGFSNHCNYQYHNTNEIISALIISDDMLFCIIEFPKWKENGLNNIFNPLISSNFMAIHSYIALFFPYGINSIKLHYTETR